MRGRAVVAMFILAGLGTSCAKAEPRADEGAGQAQAAPEVEAQPEFAPVPASVQGLLDERGACLELPGSFSVVIVDADGKGRVQFEAVPSEGGFVLAYSLGAVEADTSQVEALAARMMHVFMHNFAAADQVGPPTTLPEATAKAHGADLAVRACFTPAPYLGEGEFGHGVAYGLFKRDVGTTLLLVFSEDTDLCAQPPGLERFGFSHCR